MINVVDLPNEFRNSKSHLVATNFSVKCMFVSVVQIIFQSIFFFEIYQNNIFIRSQINENLSIEG